VPHWLHSLLHGLDSLRHSLHWGDVPAYLSAAVAIVFGILSLRSSRRSKAAERASKDQADRATKAAEDAVAAQNKIAAEIRRLGDDSARQREDEERAPRRVDKLSAGRLSGRMAATTLPRSPATAPSTSIYLSGRSNFRTRQSR
jgi:hypothetical protein